MEIRKVYPAPEPEKKSRMIEEKINVNTGKIETVVTSGRHNHVPLPAEPVDFGARLDKFETRWLKRAMKLCQNNISTAARYLQLNRTTLHEKLKRRNLLP